MYPTLFHHESWTESWQSSEFPPDETAQERYQRFRAKPGWRQNGWVGSIPEFFQSQVRSSNWPWGYVIYRTTFTDTSDQDWATAIEMLDRHCYAAMERHRYLTDFKYQPNICEIIREGYRNVVIKDPSLEGASVDVIRIRHIQWVEERGFIRHSGVPRFDYCLLLDSRSVRSILASTEPDKPGMIGYVNVVDCDFEYDPNDPDNECSEYYDGSVRVSLDSLFQFALRCEDLQMGEQAWGDWGMECPGRVIYSDGYSSKIEIEDVFLRPYNSNLFSLQGLPDSPRKVNITESQYEKGMLESVLEIAH